MLKKLEIHLNEADGRALFSALNIEVATIPVTEYETVPHNQEKPVIHKKLVVVCPHRGQYVDFYEAYEAIFRHRLGTLILETPRIDAFVTLRNLSPIKVNNNDKN